MTTPQNNNLGLGPKYAKAGWKGEVEWLPLLPDEGNICEGCRVSDTRGQQGRNLVITKLLKL